MKELGMNPKDVLGLKKAPLRLVPPVALIECAAVMALGARKYGPYNWRENKVRHSVYLEAAMRHLLQAMDGEDADPESGRPHEAHVMACMALFLDAKHTGNFVDDRNKSGCVTNALADVAAMMKSPDAPPEVTPEAAPKVSRQMCSQCAMDFEVTDGLCSACFRARQLAPPPPPPPTPKCQKCGVMPPDADGVLCSHCYRHMLYAGQDPTRVTREERAS